MVDNAQFKREFIFANVFKSKLDKGSDAIIIKERIHAPDGRIKPNLRIVKDYQIPFYITKPEYRNYEEKKEFEYISRCDKYYSNLASLPYKVRRALGEKPSPSYKGLSEVNRSPYVYGTSISPVSLIADEYSRKYPDTYNDSTLAVLDYEWTTGSKNTILCGVLSFKDQIHIAVTDDFIGDIGDRAEALFLEELNRHLGHIVKERNIKVKFTQHKSQARVVIALMKTAHELKPDFIGVWSIAGDMTRMLAALAEENIDPALVFSDPSVPNEYKSFHWKEDQPFKLKSNGQRTKKNFNDLWHVATFPATFHFVCLMAVYKHIRIRNANLPSYSLDTVLKHELNLAKLKFDMLPEGITQLDWHIAMQSRFKIPYLVYLLWDGVSCEILDEKTGDIAKTFRSLWGVSLIKHTKSNPTRVSDDAYFDFLKQGKVLAGISDEMKTPFDQYVPSLKRWIIALPSELEFEIGAKLINEYPHMFTNISVASFDVDVTSAYPTTGIILNVGKSTRIFELCKIPGLTEYQQREIGINMTNVRGNCISLAQVTYGFPKLDVLLADFRSTL